MTTMKLDNSIPRMYANNGQHAEQVVRFTLTGRIEKADRVKHDQGTDCADLQIKSARATVCKGTDLKAYLAQDKAKRFAYVVKDFSLAYIMDREEWEEFCEIFGTITRESKQNDEQIKIRLNKEGKAMVEWLRART